MGDVFFWNVSAYFKFVDVLEHQKTYCPSKGYEVRLLKMIRQRTIFGNNKPSSRNGSSNEPANCDICRQLKVRKRGKGVKEKRVQGGET